MLEPEGPVKKYPSNLIPTIVLQNDTIVIFDY